MQRRGAMPLNLKMKSRQKNEEHAQGLSLARESRNSRRRKMRIEFPQRIEIRIENDTSGMCPKCTSQS